MNTELYWITLSSNKHATPDTSVHICTIMWWVVARCLAGSCLWSVLKAMSETGPLSFKWRFWKVGTKISQSKTIKTVWEGGRLWRLKVESVDCKIPGRTLHWNILKYEVYANFWEHPQHIWKSHEHSCAHVTALLFSGWFIIASSKLLWSYARLAAIRRSGNSQNNRISIHHNWSIVWLYKYSKRKFGFSHRRLLESYCIILHFLATKYCSQSSCLFWI